MRIGRICTLEFTRTAIKEGYRQPIPFQKLDRVCSDPKHSEIENIFNKSTLQPEKKSNTLLPCAPSPKILSFHCLKIRTQMAACRVFFNTISALSDCKPPPNSAQWKFNLDWQAY